MIAFRHIATTIARPAMKNQPSVTIVVPTAPYSWLARPNRSGRYSWLTTCIPVRVPATRTAPGSRTAGSFVARGSSIEIASQTST
jgi:hypothetical protein